MVWESYMLVDIKTETWEKISGNLKDLEIAKTKEQYIIPITIIKGHNLRRLKLK